MFITYLVMVNIFLAIQTRLLDCQSLLAKYQQQLTEQLDKMSIQKVRETPPSNKKIIIVIILCDLMINPYSVVSCQNLTSVYVRF